MPRRKSAFTFVEVLVVIAVIALLIAVLLPATRSGREPARRNSCHNNLKQIGLALLNYESEHGEFPPAYTVDEEGNRLHSWRTLLLPYMEQTQLYESIDLTKPWDDPVNAEAHDTIVDVYECPSSPEPHGLTTYLAVVGPEQFFTGSTPRKRSEMTDSPSATIMVIDVRTQQPIHWMAPEDASEEVILSAESETSSYHPGTIQAAFADGHPKSFSPEIDRDTLRAMLTIAGGEEPSDF